MRKFGLALLSIALMGFPISEGSATGRLILGAPASGGAAAYTGPGDVTTFSQWYGIRAYSAAKRGTAAINVCNSTGGVDVGCADLSTDATTGKLVSATVSAITCPGTNCTIKTFYDQTGGGGDCTQATVASRATLPATGGPGSNPTASFNGSQNYTCGTTTGTQPVSLSAVADRTGNTSAFNSVISFGFTVDLLFNNSTNSVGEYAGSVLATAATDGSFHAVQALANGASSSIYVDGSSTAGNAGTTSPSTNTRFGTGVGGSCTCNIVEGGTIASDKSANFAALNSNQHSFWGF